MKKMSLIITITIIGLLAVTACFFFIQFVSGATGSAAAETPSQPVMLSGVPDVHQAEYYSCGASSFQAVMNYYGLDSFESDLRTRLNTTPAHGTYPWDMVRVARELGFTAEWRENLTLADLETSLRSGVPVIIDGQRFKNQNKTWEDTWNTGHYMVVFGIDNQNVYLEDPAMLGFRLALPREEFISLWHDYECELPVPPDAHKYYHLGVFIHGTPRTVTNTYVNMTVLPPMIPPA